MQKIQLALTQEWASSRGPSPTVRPSDYQMIGQRFWGPELLLSHQFGFCRLFGGLSRQSTGYEVWQTTPGIPTLSQSWIRQSSQSSLDKLSSGASRKPVVTILSYWHRSSHQPPRAGTPPSPLFLHHRAMSTMLQVRGWSPPLA